MADFSFDDTGPVEPDKGIVAADFLTGDGGDTGAVDANGTRFDPAIHSGPDKFNADGSYRKKRGRKSGSVDGGTARTSSGSKTSRKTDHTASVESLSRVLLVLHLGIAGVTKTPELALEQEESEALATATARVLEEFDIRPNPKAEAIIALGVTAGSIYGPRVYLIADRRKKERDDQRAE